MKEEEVRKPLSELVSRTTIGDGTASTLDSEMGFKPDPKSESKPGSKAKLVAFSLMLAVPAVLAGCGSNNDECDPEYDTGCEYDSSSGHYYYGGYGGSSYRSSKDGSSSYKSSTKSKSSGFGSFFRSSGG
jgi:hypothetical protein